MPSLKEVKTRIGSVKSTRKITNAMKMVASSKLHHAQRAIECMRPYEKRLASIINQGITPVLAPLTFDGHEHLLNTNADTIAGETAKAMAHLYDVSLVYCFEKRGVLTNPDDDNSVIPEIHADNFAKLVEDGVVSGGMIPKIQNALQAVEAGVKRVIITAAKGLDTESGTKILP